MADGNVLYSKNLETVRKLARDLMQMSEGKAIKPGRGISEEYTIKEAEP